MANKESWNVKSRVVSARLHPDNEQERLALEILDEKINEGESIRNIITDALIRSGGYTPEMFSGDDRSITQSQLERSLSDFATYLLGQIKDGIVTIPSDISSNRTQLKDDEDEAVMQNIAKGYMNRTKRS